jgi:hypothetical protein
MTFSRSIDMGPAGPWLAAAVIFNGSLAVFTGFPKSTADLCVLALAVAVLGLEYLRTGRRGLAFGITLSVALLDHRSMLVLGLPGVFAWAVRWVKRDRVGAIARSALPPLVAGVLLTWGIAAASAADWGSARRAFLAILEEHPDDPVAWVGLGGASGHLGDSATVARARERAAGYAQDPDAGLRIRSFLAEHPGVWPELASALAR